MTNNRTKKFRGGVVDPNQPINPVNNIPSSPPKIDPTEVPPSPPNFEPPSLNELDETQFQEPDEFDGPPPEGQYDGPPPEGQYDGPPPEGQYDGPPPEGQYDGPPPPSSEETTSVEAGVAGVATGAAIAETVKQPLNPEEESAEIKDFREKMADPANHSDYVYINSNISTEPNKNNSFVRIGVLHFTDSMGINAVRDTLTSIGNLFGSKGFDNLIYDKLRNIALTKVGILLGENRRCYNTTIQIDRMNDTVFAHICGTLYEKKTQV
jgi:hypothetical protein